MPPGIGPTAERSLRVSAATLAQVVFQHPDDGRTMLALEHKAGVVIGDGEPQFWLRAQPFGGAVRLLKPKELSNLLGGFNYDSQRSASERDLRLFIRPSAWDDLVDVCRRAPDERDPWIDVNPIRELQEEFADALGIELAGDQIAIEPLRTLIERDPTPTANLRAPGRPTARIYWAQRVTVVDRDLTHLILRRSEDQTVAALRQSALANVGPHGRGRANGILLAPLSDVEAAFRTAQPGDRERPLPFEGTWLAGNVAAVLAINSERYEIL